MPYAQKKLQAAPWGLDAEPDHWESTAKRAHAYHSDARSDTPSASSLAGMTSSALCSRGPEQKIYGERAESTASATPAQKDSVGSIIWVDYGRRKGEGRVVPPKRNTGKFGHAHAEVAGHSSSRISLLTSDAGIYSPEGRLIVKDANNLASGTEANKAREDGSGHLNDVIFADYSKKADKEVAKVNFGRPGKKSTALSNRMNSASYDLIANTSAPQRPRHGRRSVGPYSALLGGLMW